MGAFCLRNPSAAAATEDDRWEQFGEPSEVSGTTIFDGANGRINVIIKDGDDVYVGGSFSRIGDIEANNLARWDGLRWHSIGEGSSNGVNGEVFALIKNFRMILAGGDFNLAGGVAANHVARWDGTNWFTLGTGHTNGVNARVRAIAAYPDVTYVGGDFTEAGGMPAGYIARFSPGDGWQNMRGGMNDFVHALQLGRFGVLAGGRFTQTAEGTPLRHIARWDDTFEEWLPLGSPADYVPNNGVDGFVNAIVLIDDLVYVGGSFSRAGLVSANNIASWEDRSFGGGWREVGGGVQGDPAAVYALAAHQNKLYVAGEFSAAGGRLSSRNVAKWDGNQWIFAPENGVNDTVNTVVAAGESLYVGGRFTAAGDRPAGYIALWSARSWFPLGQGLNDLGKVAVLHGNDLYVGGRFTMAGEVPANYIARWDGANWHSIGQGSENGLSGWVNDIVITNGFLYAAGYFTNAGSTYSPAIARWSLANQQWLSMGSGLGRSDSFFGPSAERVAIRGNDVYVAGTFTEAGGTPATNVARWNGSQWSSLGGGVPFLGGTFPEASLALAGADLYVAGSFYEAGGVAATNIARWDGSNWHPLIYQGVNGTQGPIRALISYGSSIYAAESAGVGDRVSQWDGSAWSYRQDSSRILRIFCLRWSDNELFVGCSANPNLALFQWGASRWDSVGGPVFETNSVVRDIAFGRDTLYAAGTMQTLDGFPVNRIAQFKRGARAEWQTLTPLPSNSAAVALAAPASPGLGLDAAVTVLAGSGPYIYAGGFFTNAGGVAARGLARWNGTRWANIGNVGGNTGNGQVMALATSGNNLYVGGALTQIDNEPVQNIAHWNGVSWSRLGRATTNIIFIPPFGAITNITIDSPLGQVRAIAVVGSNVFAGGHFTSPGYSIVRWDGANWSKLSDAPLTTNSFEPTDGLTGLNGFPGGPGDCNAIVFRGSDLFVAGNFSRAGTNAANNVARWDGARWHSLGAGVNGSVLAMFLDSTRLYVGGYFTEAGGVAATNLACWDGARWTAVDPTFQEQVYTLALHGNHLYIGGVFTNAGGVPAANIARWDGTVWSSLGSGITGGSFPYVNALLLKDNSLYVGGGFTSAGARPSYNFARWSLAAADPSEWRTIYFTLTERADPGISGDDADPDGDGMTNRQEYLAGTDPRSAQSVFDVSSVQPSGDSVVVTFQAAPGRTYTVQYRDGIGEPATWNRLADIPSRSSAGTETVIDSIPSPDVRFYRVVSPAVP